VRFSLHRQAPYPPNVGARVKRFSGIERQALRKLDMLHQRATLPICAPLRPTGSRGPRQGAEVLEKTDKLR
jgi:hypothetical protein